MANESNKTVKVRLVRGLRGTQAATVCRSRPWA